MSPSRESPSWRHRELCGYDPSGKWTQQSTPLRSIFSFIDLIVTLNCNTKFKRITLAISKIIAQNFPMNNNVNPDREQRAVPQHWETLLAQINKKQIGKYRETYAARFNMHVLLKLGSCWNPEIRSLSQASRMAFPRLARKSFVITA